MCGFNTGFHIFLHSPPVAFDPSGRYQRRLSRPVLPRVNLFSARGGPCRGGVFHVPVNRRNTEEIGNPIFIFIYLHAHTRRPLSGYRFLSVLCVKNPLLSVLSAKRVPATTERARERTPNRFYLAFTRRVIRLFATARNTRLSSFICGKINKTLTFVRSRIFRENIPTRFAVCSFYDRSVKRLSIVVNREIR